MKPRKWTVEQLKSYAKESSSMRQLLGALGLRQAGGNYAQVKKYIVEFSIDTSHFLGQGWNIDGKNLIKERAELSTLLVQNSTYQSFKLKRRLILEKIKLEQCEKCQWAEVSKDGRIPLELHHINGNRTDNRLENLQILCPNCHSLQDSYRGRNIGSYN